MARGSLWRWCVTLISTSQRRRPSGMWCWDHLAWQKPSWSNGSLCGILPARMNEWNGWMEWMNEMGEWNGWMKWVNGMDEWNGWMQWMNGMDEWNGWTEWMNGINEWNEWMEWMNGMNEWMEWMIGVNDWNEWVEWMSGRELLVDVRMWRSNSFFFENLRAAQSAI